MEAFRNQTTATHPQSGRPYNLTEQAFQVLRCILWKSCQRSADSVTTGLQTAAHINISTKAVHWELHKMGFHVYADPVAVSGPVLMSM